LQKKRFLNQVAIRTNNPIMFSNTNDFNANTEFSIIKGLVQFDKPESFPQPRGNATRIAIASEMNRMGFLLTKINILGK